MRKEEFLSVLKENLKGLPDSEVENKIRYYNDYFDEVGDDETASQALGNPSDLALSILKENGMENKESPVSKNTSRNVEKKVSSGGLFFEFDPVKVKNINMSLGAVQVVVIPGKTYTFETRGFSPDEFTCCIDKAGSLVVVNNSRIPGAVYLSHSHDTNRRFLPRILMTVPPESALYGLTVRIGAGSFKTHDVHFKYQTGIFGCGAGNLVLNRVTGEKTSLRCGAGNLKVKGRLLGKTLVDCCSGNTELCISGKKDSYSYDSRSILGNVRFDEEKSPLVGTKNPDTVLENHISVNCIIGSAKISFE